MKKKISILTILIILTLPMAVVAGESKELKDNVNSIEYGSKKLDETIKNAPKQIERNLGKTTNRVKAVLWQRTKDRAVELIQEKLNFDINEALGDIGSNIFNLKKDIESLIGSTRLSRKQIEDIIFNEKTIAVDSSLGVEFKNYDYSIKREITNQVTRDLILEKLEEDSLSEEGQEKRKKFISEIGKDAEISNKLGEDSRKSDVSQQILQNISAQTSINSGLLAKQSVQEEIAQESRDISNMLLHQIAEATTEEATKNRRQSRKRSLKEFSMWGSFQTPYTIGLESDD